MSHPQSYLLPSQLPVQNVFHWHGIPLDTASDQGPQFSSAAWKTCCQALGASVSLSPGFHPHTKVQYEWANQYLESTLCRLMAANQETWNSYLSWFKCSHSSQVITVTGGVTPFEASVKLSLPPSSIKINPVFILSQIKPGFSARSACTLLRISLPATCRWFFSSLTDQLCLEPFLLLLAVVHQSLMSVFFLPHGSFQMFFLFCLFFALKHLIWAKHLDLSWASHNSYRLRLLDISHEEFFGFLI